MKIFISRSAARYDPAWNALTFEEAKAEAAKRFAARDAADAELKEFLAKHEKGAAGLTPDSVKAMPEFKKLYNAYWAANDKCNFNLWLQSKFKKQLNAERKANRKY